MPSKETIRADLSKGISGMRDDDQVSIRVGDLRAVLDDGKKKSSGGDSKNERGDTGV